MTPLRDIPILLSIIILVSSVSIAYAISDEDRIDKLQAGIDKLLDRIGVLEDKKADLDDRIDKLQDRIVKKQALLDKIIGVPGPRVVEITDELLAACEVGNDDACFSPRIIINAGEIVEFRNDGELELSVIGIAPNGNLVSICTAHHDESCLTHDRYSGIAGDHVYHIDSNGNHTGVYNLRVFVTVIDQ